MIKFSIIITLFVFGVLFVPPIMAQAPAEFRGVWIATVDNIDWPSAGNFNSDSQKAEFIKILDMHQRNGLNAMVVQVRPCTDAFYPSQYEPWSQWLTGVQGQPPSPYYDPLEFMISETHKRGMVFHAWVNPYRAEFNIYTSVTSPTHVTRIHPEWFVTYGDKRYFDPGNKQAQEYVTEVITDIVKRYPVDAIHFDDYFYPYRIAGKDFPDDASYKKYGNGMRKDDWRRSNTDSIISKLSRAIKRENPICQFGISPFGVWRNQEKDPINGSKTNGASSNYDDLYADILLWLKKDWIDYVAPQLYWEFGHRIAPYEVLLDWWSKHTYGKHCYIGLGIYKANSNAAWRDNKQLPRQIEALRKKANINGMIFFSSKSFESNPNGWSDSLRLNYFKDRVPVPEMEWLKKWESKNLVDSEHKSFRILNKTMITNWTELGKKIDSIKDDGSETGGDNYAKLALENILGDEWIKTTVEHILSYKSGSELAMNCLQFISSKKAAILAYEIYKKSKGDYADRAVWLIKHIGHPIAIEWIEEFINDSNVCHWGIGVLDQLLWSETIPYDNKAILLLQLAETKESEQINEQVQFIRQYIEERINNIR